MTELYKDKTTTLGFKEAPDRQISHIRFDSHWDTRKRSNSTDHKYISQGPPLEFFFHVPYKVYENTFCLEFCFLDGEKISKK